MHMYKYGAVKQKEKRKITEKIHGYSEKRYEENVKDLCNKTEYQRWREMEADDLLW